MFCKLQPLKSIQQSDFECILKGYIQTHNSERPYNDKTLLNHTLPKHKCSNRVNSLVAGFNFQ